MARIPARKPSSSTLRDPWEALSPQVRHGICLIILIILPTILFPSVFWGDERFMGHDTVQWRASAESVIEARDSSGEEPLWSSDQFAGMPAYLVSYQKMVPNLDNLISLPGTLYPPIYFWVMLTGMYFFLVTLGFRPLSSTLGSVLAGFSTYLPIIIGAGHNTKFVALAFIPWVLLGYVLLTRNTGNRWASTFVLTCSFVLQVRAGHPQITYYFLWVLAIWFFFDLYKAWKNGSLKEFAPITGLIGIAALITLLANAQPYWSIYEYSPFSIRGGGGGGSTSETGLDLTYAFAWSQGWGELLTLLIPGAYGGAELYWGPKSVTSGPHYFGAFTALLVLLGIWKSTFRFKWVFFGASVLTILFSLGSNFPALNNAMFYYMPMFDKFRVPETWLVVPAFCLPIIAVAGLDYLLDRVDNLTPSDWLPAILPVAALSIIFAFASGNLLSFDKPGQAQQFAQQIAQANQVEPTDPRVIQQVNEYIESSMKPERKAAAAADSQRFLMLITAGVGILFAVTRKMLPAGPATLLLLLIASYDMISVGQRYVNDHSLVPKSFDAERAVEQTRRPIDTWLQQNTASDEPWRYRVFPLSENPFNNALPSYFYPSLGGYSGARMALFDELMDGVFFAGVTGINNGVLAMLNTKYMTYSPGLGLPGWEMIHSDQNSAVYELTAVLPKAWFADKVDIVTNRDVAKARLIAPDFDGKANAFVESNGSVSTQPDSTAQARVTVYGPREIQIETQRSNGSGLLVLSEMYYPAGWTATVNGNEAEILKTNYVLRGVMVPEGNHTVVFRFDPGSHTHGTRIAFAGHGLLLLLGGMALWTRLRKRETTVSE